MIRVTSKGQVSRMDYSAKALCFLGFLELTDENFWEVREKIRHLNGVYTQIFLPGDDDSRSLHVSLTDASRVAYTESAEKGRLDIQTVTTIEAYCKKYGLYTYSRRSLKMARTYIGLEIQLHGLTFVVSGTYVPADEATQLVPGEPATFVLRDDALAVKGQPEADAWAILESMRSNISSRGWTSGWEELIDLCIEVAES